MVAETLNEDTYRLEEPLAKQKRARGQLSCIPCRVGKLKCNRVRDPACDQCVKRNREDACHYVPPPPKAKPAANVKGRIRQLESLVKNLMEKQNESSKQNTDSQDNERGHSSFDPDSAQDRTTPPDPLSLRVEQSFGKLDINHGEISYKSQEHWQTILSSLSEIQRELGDEDDVLDPELSADHASISAASDWSSSSFNTSVAAGYGILGATRALTRAELLRKLPDKQVTDRLLSIWFNSADPFKVIIHAPTFQEEYKRLCQDQSVSTMWLASLFAILSLAESLRLRNAIPGTREAASDAAKVHEYQSLAASAAVLADFTKPKPYTIESLMLYMMSLRGKNASLGSWLVMGLIVRLSLRMGYHRDPENYATKMSPFQAEMRRRVWALVSMIDVLMSFQLGLPSMVRTVAADTQPPRNLSDRDFAPQSAFMLTGRNEDELTPSLYLRAKLKLVAVLAEAAELSHATTPPNADIVLKLDQDLEKAKADVPKCLQMPSFGDIVTDPAEQLMCRFNLDLLHLKCKIVLFRRYMLASLDYSSENDQARAIVAGREACVKSARRVLQHQHTIFNATRPGGQLEHMRWYMGSISTHDFLLASMVVCLELSQQLQRDKGLHVSSGVDYSSRNDMMETLEQTQRIWVTIAEEANGSALAGSKLPVSLEDSGDTNDLAKAAKAMAIMLARLKAQSSTPTPTSAYTPSTSEILSGDIRPQGQFFDNIGVTPQGARTLKERGGALYGVLSMHQWDNVPAELVYPSTSSDTQESTAPYPQDYNSAAPIPLAAFPARLMDLDGNLGGQVGGVRGDIEDQMDIPWGAWEREILKPQDMQNMDWLAQDALAPNIGMFPIDDPAINGGIPAPIGSQLHDLAIPTNVISTTALPGVDFGSV